MPKTIAGVGKHQMRAALESREYGTQCRFAVCTTHSEKVSAELNVSVQEAEGLGVILDLHRRLLAAPVTLILTDVPDDVRTTINTAGLGKEVLLIAPTAAEMPTTGPGGSDEDLNGHTQAPFTSRPARS